MEYSLFKTFVSYITYIEHYRKIEHLRRGAKIIRKGLPTIDKKKIGWRDIMEVKNFVEWVLTEDDSIVELVATDDGGSTIEALTSESKKIMMENPVEIHQTFFS